MPNSRGRQRSGRTLALAFLFLGAAAPPSFAAGAAAPVRKEWSLRLAVDERYDDNIIQLSGRDLGRLDSPSPSDQAANRFSIESADDFITVPRVSPGFEADWWRGRPTSFDLDVSAYQYPQNSIKDYQSYRLSVAQPLRAGRGRGTALSVSYALIPGFYLRNMISERHAEELGLPPPPLPRSEARFRKASVQLVADQDVVVDILSLRFVVGSERRDYNRDFDQRDSRMPYWEAGLSWTPLRDGRLRLRAAYRREDLHAVGDLDVTLGTDGDISSRRDIWDADARLRWGAKGRKKWVALAVEDEHRDFSTNNTFDAFHFGREDTRHYTTLSFRSELKKGWFLTAQAEHDTNRSRFPAAAGGTAEPNDITDYAENLAQFGIGYDFGATTGGAGRAGAPTD